MLPDREFRRARYIPRVTDSKRITIVGINYAPEHAGIAPYTTQLSEHLASIGNSTRVVTARPHYPQWQVHPEYAGPPYPDEPGDVDLIRVRHYVPQPPSGLRRLLSELSFGLQSAFARWKSPDAIVLVSPALFSAWVAMLRVRTLNRSARAIVWVQDLYSVGLEETGQGGGLVGRVTKAVESWTLKRADTVVVIHQRFADIVHERLGVTHDTIEVIGNWSHVTQVNANRPSVRARRGWANDQTVVVHSGNMGIKQGLDNVVAAAKAADRAHAPVLFVLVGDGAQRKHLEELAAGVDRLQFVDPLPSDQFMETLESADVLLLNEAPGIGDMAVPSKLTSYFASGTPVVAATDLEGIVGQLVAESGAGIVVPAGKPELLLDAVTRIASDAALAKACSDAARDYWFTQMSQEAALGAWVGVINGH